MSDFFNPLSLVGAPVRRLTKLYSDTKKSYETVAAPPDIKISDDMGLLHRKLRIQKDRLITWGLDWSDVDAASPGDIDESIERAGLSDVVASILASIQGLLEEAEHLGSGPSKESKAAWELKGSDEQSKTKWNPFNKAKFEDLIKDLTTSIDTLHDLSRTRRALRLDQSQPRKAAGYAYKDPGPAPSSSTSSSILFPSALPPSLSQTLPPTPRDTSAADVLSLRLDRSSLVIPDPPANSTPPSTQRAMGHLRRPHTSNNPWKRDGNRVPTIPVLIDYASYDPTFSSTGIFLPLEHLHELSSTLHWPDIPQETHISGTLNLLGYFEEEAESRYGMVYELPRDVYHGPQDMDNPLDSMAPVTLESILKGGSMSNTAIPCLEDRFRAACNIATSVVHLSLAGQLHGNLSSESIIFFPKVQLQDDSYSHRDVRTPFLSSFDVFSEYTIDSTKMTTSTQLMYQHPLQKSTPRTSRRFAAFEIYSLGLVMLEIGLWMPLRALRKDTYDQETFKNRLQGPYTRALLPKCGRLYMKAVQSCLMAPEQLDFESPDFERQTSRLYQGVLQKLQKCCLLDELSDAPEDEAYESSSSPGKIQRQRSSKSVHYMDSLPEYRDTPSDIDEPMEDCAAEATPVAETRQSFIPMTPVSEFEVPVTTKRSPIMQPRPRLRVHPLQLTPEELDEWHDKILPRLEKILTRTLKEANETVTIDLLRIGESSEVAKTTVVVTCTSVSKVKAILKRRFKNTFSSWDLKVRRGKLHRSSGRERGIKRSLSRRSSRGVKRKRAAIERSSASVYDDDDAVMNPFHQQRPSCGASIGAFKNEEHLPPVSLGGVILVDGEPYGMTVHHILEEPSDVDDSDSDNEEYPTRSSASWYAQQQMPGFEEESPWLPNRSLGAFSYEISDEEPTSSDSEDDDDFLGSDLDEAYDTDEDLGGIDRFGESFGDTPGIRKEEGTDIIITQPAIDDVDDEFFRKEEERDEDHLDSHTLGSIHASSGVKRLQKDGIIHEIDWALFRIDDDRLQPHNLIQGGRRYSRHGGAAEPPALLHPVSRSRDYSASEDLYPTVVAEVDDLGSMEVHCLGRTSGLMGGVISPAMSSLKVYGRKTYSRSWQVMGGFGVGGDSGAWVIDNEEGKVCGHVLAWCEKNCIAYICPMDILLEDIARTLKVSSLALPGGELLCCDDDLVDLESLHISREPSRRSTRNEKVEKDLQAAGVTEKDVNNLRELIYRDSKVGPEALKASS